MDSISFFFTISFFYDRLGYKFNLMGDNVYEFQSTE
jgi:hypothetical protein